MRQHGREFRLSPITDRGVAAKVPASYAGVGPPAADHGGHRPNRGSNDDADQRPQREQTGVAGDLATGEIGTDGLITIEGKVQLW